MPSAQQNRRMTTKMAACLLLLAALILSGLYACAAYEQSILGWMQAHQEWMQEKVRAYPLLGPVVYIAVFALVIGFYIPGGIVLLLMAGALFPFWEANLYANIGNLLGATIGFFLSRVLLHDEMQDYFGDRLEPLNRGIRESGWFYLLLLRIAPVLPSPLINLGMGLTPITTSAYMLVTLLGRMPMTLIYVNLGKELSKIDRLGELLSREVLFSLLLIAALMLCAHLLLQRRRAVHGG